MRITEERNRYRRPGEPENLRGFAHVPDALAVTGDSVLGGEEHISMYGPTVGDHVRLGDTSLWVTIECDSVGIPVLPYLRESDCSRLFMVTRSSLAEVIPSDVFFPVMVFMVPPGKTMGWAGRPAGARKTAKGQLISSSPMPSSCTGPEPIRCVYSCHSSHKTHLTTHRRRIVAFGMVSSSPWEKLVTRMPWTASILPWS